MHQDIWMTDNQDDNRNSGLSFLIEGLKRSFQAIDQIIHQSVINLCVGNPTSPHFAITWTAATVGSSLILIVMFLISLFLNSVSFKFFLETFLAQPPFVIVSVGFFAPVCWVIMLGFVSHNHQITACEAASRGVRITLYVILALYTVVFTFT